MGMTITEKIIAAHSGKSRVQPGEFVYADVDIALGNDITAPLAIHEFEAAGLGKVFDPGRIVLIPDHFTPNKDIKSAEQSKLIRRFAREQEITHYYEVGRCGIEHAFLPEQGIVVPGDLVIGADSHTCTYGAIGAFATGVGSTDLAACMATGKVWLRVPPSLRFVFKGTLPKWLGGKDLVLFTIGKIGVDGARYKAMEVCGPVIAGLNMDERLSLCNMAIEAGAKNGIIAPDAVTLEYVQGRALRPFKIDNLYSDPDAAYNYIKGYDVARLEPQVACPPSPGNVKPVSQLGEVSIDQAVIGSCTNGRLEDLQQAAQVIKGRRVAKGVRLIIIPATPLIYRQAMDQGLLAIFLEAGAVIGPPTCGPCLGGHMGILAPGETAIATTNRNFVGRMGHPESKVYLANPAVAAASAVTGRISGPAQL